MSDEFTLEKMEVNSRLGKLEESVTRLIITTELHQKQTSDIVKNQQDLLSKFGKIVLGNGEIGLIGKIDRNSQRLDSWNKMLWAILITVVGLIGKAAYDFIASH